MAALLNDPVIVGFVRTPLGKYGGILSSLRSDDMLAAVMTAVVAQAKIDPSEIDEVIAGCANQAGEDNRNVARMACLLADFPHQTPAYTINRLCASGLDAIISGARQIITGEHNLVLAAGVESMSRAPYVLAKPDGSFKLGAPEIFDSSLGWRFFNEKMRAHTPPEPNGATAENLVERFKISRARQDEFALRSHQKACEAQQRGDFAREIIGVAIENGRQEKTLVDKDEGPRPDTNLAKLAMLKPAFAAGGSVTAGNSSSLNDGAACVAIASMSYAKKHGLKPQARILGFASAGVNPREMGIGPVASTKKLTARYGINVRDFHTIEINEAFAAQVIAVMDELKLDEARINPYGGAIALGHPLGCSGVRIVATLINNLRHTGRSLGLATLCVGVGQGVSMALEAI